MNYYCNCCRYNPETDRIETARQLLQAIRNWYLALGWDLESVDQATLPESRMAGMRLSVKAVNDKYFSGADISNLVRQLIRLLKGRSPERRIASIAQIVDFLPDSLVGLEFEHEGDPHEVAEATQALIIACKQMAEAEAAFNEITSEQRQLVQDQLNIILESTETIKRAVAAIAEYKKQGGAEPINQMLMDQIFGPGRDGTASSAIRELYPPNRLF
jgi:hypothetical protein